MEDTLVLYVKASCQLDDGWISERRTLQSAMSQSNVLDYLHQIIPRFNFYSFVSDSKDWTLKSKHVIVKLSEKHLRMD